MHVLALVALLGQLNCCVQGGEIVTELEFDGGVFVERLIIRGQPPCARPGIHVRSNFHEELRQSAELI